MTKNIDIGSETGVAMAATIAMINTARRQDFIMLAALSTLAKLSKTSTTGKTKARPNTTRMRTVNSMYSLALMTLAAPFGVKPIRVETKLGSEIQASQHPAKNSGMAAPRKPKV